ncbi:hypothetical protein B0T10DRAFT_14552 [Thelonectria olida]|uniref:Uncharacterized protein n=1 Tax=Thelonectria olida TaxID=1576542 RepID=A0A9P9AXC4_9HYPO|nr:hypothetical protein B0T10DRAFT_14552 [Thelonectria olida]
MNPNAATFKPAPVSPEPVIGRQEPIQTSSRRSLKGSELRSKKDEKTTQREVLDPSNYDDMFPSLDNLGPTKGRRTSSKARNTRRGSRFVAKKAEEPRDSKAALPPSLASSIQGTDMSGNSEKPTLKSPIPKQPKHETRGLVPATPLKPASVENKKEAGDPNSSSAPLTNNLEAIGLIRARPNMPPTPKPDHEVPVGPRALKGVTSNRQTSSVSYVPVHTPPCPAPAFPAPFGHPRAMPSPAGMPYSGQSFYPQQYVPPNSPGFTPMPQYPIPQYPMPHYPIPQYPIPQYPMPQYPIPQAHMPQVQGHMGQVAWEPPLSEPGPGWPSPHPSSHFGSPYPQPWQAMGHQQPQYQTQAFSNTNQGSNGFMPFQVPDRGKSQRMDPRWPNRLYNRGVIQRPTSTPTNRAQAGASKPVEGWHSKPRGNTLTPSRAKGPPTEFIEFRSEPASSQPSSAAKLLTQQPLRLPTRDKGRNEAPLFNQQGIANQADPGRPVPAVQGLNNGRPASEIEPPPSQSLPNTTPAKTQMNQVSSPLQGAPKGPKSSKAMQIRAPRTALLQNRSPVGASSDKNGSWSQSKRWVRGEVMEKAAFQKMLISLRYMSADKSPSIPQNAAELTAFKAELAESEKVKLLEEVQKKQVSAKTDEKDQGKQLVLFRGKQLQDNLSPVFAATNCFNSEPANKDGPRVEWPSLAEFKDDGDKRSFIYGRCFPLARLNVLAIQVPPGFPGPIPNSDGSIRWTDKRVRVVPRDIIPVNSPDSDSENMTESGEVEA